MVFVFLLVGCGNSRYKDTEQIVLENNYDETKSDINILFDRLSMFPTEEDENDVITYLQVIYDNKDNFTKEELTSFKNLYLDYQYSYRLNTIGYDINKVNILIENLDK